MRQIGEVATTELIWVENWVEELRGRLRIFVEGLVCVDRLLKRERNQFRDILPIQSRHDDVLTAARQVRDRESNGWPTGQLNLVDHVTGHLVVRPQHRLAPRSLPREQQGRRHEET